MQSTINNAVLQEEAECIMEVSIESLPMSRETLQLYKQSQSKDPICSSVINYSRSGWPKVKSQVAPDLRAYWNVRGLLTIHQDFLLYENRLVVPKDMRKRTLQKIHDGHQGIERCLLRAKTAVCTWWPGLQKEVYNMVKQCQTCAKQNTQTCEPLLPTKLPAYPWQRVALDLFTLKGVNYLVVVDYFSRFPEVKTLTTTTSEKIILSLKEVFSHHGIPETLVTDNGPQFTSQEFIDFAKSYGFNHTTSSPHFLQSNGKAE